MSNKAKKPKVTQKPLVTKENTNGSVKKSSIPEVKTHGEWWRYGGGYTHMIAPLDQFSG